MLALYQSGFAILGTGINLATCLSDALQYGFEMTHEQVQDRTTPNAPTGEIDGASICGE